MPRIAPVWRQNRRFLRAAAAVLAVVLLSGCYLPDRFTLQINMQRDGEYAFIYEGDLLAFNFLRKIGAGDVSANDADEIQVYDSDLRRDSGFSEVDYVGQGRYRVKYRRQSNILERPSFSFVRRNAPFMTIKRNAQGLVTLTGDRPNKQYRDELVAKGFNTRGVVRLWTDARVLDHNANQVIQGSPTQYVWNIESIQQPAPRLILVPGQ